MSKSSSYPLVNPADDPILSTSILRVYEYATGYAANTNLHSGHYIVRCPVEVPVKHVDKNPSCSLDPRKDSWRCFACGGHGGKMAMIIANGKARTNAEAAAWLKSVVGSRANFTFKPQPAVKQNQKRGAAEILKNERLIGKYDYVNEAGKVVYQVLRMEGDSVNNGRGKRFSQQQPGPTGGWIKNLANVQRFPYRLDELIAARDAKPTPRAVLLPEGEKVADILRFVDFTATTIAEGATMEWRPAWNEYIAPDGIVFVLGDADVAGREAMEKRAKALDGPNRTIIKVDLFPDRVDGSDLLDWLIDEKIVANLKDKAIVAKLEQPINWAKALIVSKEEARKRIQAKLTGYYRAQKAVAA